MTTLQLNERVFPTDLLFRNFFDTNSMFQSFVETKPNYPVDIYTLGNELCFDIACVGLDKEDINIQTEGNKMLFNASHRVLALLFLSYLKKKSRFWLIFYHF